MDGFDRLRQYRTEPHDDYTLRVPADRMLARFSCERGDTHARTWPAGQREPNAWDQAITRQIRATLLAEDATIAAVLDLAAAGPHGVRVDRTLDGSLITARVDATVPAGQIHEHRGGQP